MHLHSNLEILTYKTNHMVEIYFGYDVKISDITV